MQPVFTKVRHTVKMVHEEVGCVTALPQYMVESVAHCCVPPQCMVRVVTALPQYMVGELHTYTQLLNSVSVPLHCMVGELHTYTQLLNSSTTTLHGRRATY